MAKANRELKAEYWKAHTAYNTAKKRYEDFMNVTNNKSKTTIVTHLHHKMLKAKDLVDSIYNELLATRKNR